MGGPGIYLELQFGTLTEVSVANCLAEPDAGSVESFTFEASCLRLASVKVKM